MSDASKFSTWTESDYMGAATRYEEEARLLQAEARGMENIETLIWPYLQVKAVEQAGVNLLIDRRLKEADEMMNLAKWHRQEALVALNRTKISVAGPAPTQPAFTTGNGKSVGHATPHSYLRDDWMEEENLWGW